MFEAMFSACARALGLFPETILLSNLGSSAPRRSLTKADILAKLPSIVRDDLQAATLGRHFQGPAYGWRAVLIFAKQIPWIIRILELL